MDICPDLPPAADPQPDWACLLPREALHEIVFILGGALPPPVPDDPAGEIRRDRAAIAAVAALAPENAAEARLAAQFVAADAWALDCLRLAGERRRELEIARKCRAQAMSLMRESKSALRMLLKLQAGRRATEQDPAAANRAAWTGHAAAEMMAEALEAASPPVPAIAPGGDATDAPLQGASIGPVSNDVPEDQNRCRETEPRQWPRQGVGAF